MDGWWAASYVVLWCLVLVLCVVVVALARQVGTLHLRLGPRGALEIDDEGPPIGEAPMPIAAADSDGNPITIGGPGRAQLLLFVSATCRVCEEIIPGLGVVANGGGLEPLILSDDTSGLEILRERRLPSRPIASAQATRVYSVPGTPYAVILDRSGIVRAKGTVNNLEQLEGLVDTAQRRISSATDKRAAI
jgi:methylamine dehydrogenase accessory protein MauD